MKCPFSLFNCYKVYVDIDYNLVIGQLLMEKMKSETNHCWVSYFKNISSSKKHLISEE